MLDCSILHKLVIVHSFIEYYSCDQSNNNSDEWNFTNFMTNFSLAVILLRFHIGYAEKTEVAEDFKGNRKRDPSSRTHPFIAVKCAYLEAELTADCHLCKRV